MKRRIVLLGPPACGKGTQAEEIHNRYGFPLASPGAMLREEMKNGTDFGREAHALTSRGQLVSDQFILAVIGKWIAEQSEGAFVFDGFPRTLGQAKGLDEILSKRQIELDVVLGFEAETALLKERVAARLVCNVCGRSYGMRLHGLTTEARCPVCAGQLIRRADDSVEALEVRMEEYEEKTLPLFEYYSQTKLLRTVAADSTPERVFGAVRQILEHE